MFSCAAHLQGREPAGSRRRRLWAAGGERACLSSCSPPFGIHPGRRCSGEPRLRPPFLRVHLRVRQLLVESRPTGFPVVATPDMGSPYFQPERTSRRACAHLERPSSFRCHSQILSRGPASRSEANQCTASAFALGSTPSRRVTSARQRFRRRSHASAPPETSERATTALPCPAAKRRTSPPPRPGASSWSPLGSRPLLLAPRSCALAFEPPG